MKSMARWIQRQTIFMDKLCTEEMIQQEFIQVDEESGCPPISWVRNHGGTLGYGQFLNIEDEERETKIDMEGKWIFEEDCRAMGERDTVEGLQDGYLEWYESDIEEDDI